MQTQLDESRLKQIFKEALIEALEEKKDVFHELIVEAIEDIGMINATVPFDLKRFPGCGINHFDNFALAPKLVY